MSTQQTAFELEIATLMVEVLHLDMKPQEIAPKTPLFSDDGLGLDSIDALELSTVLEKKYSCGLRSSQKSDPDVFHSLSSLAKFVETNQTS